MSKNSERIKGLKARVEDITNKQKLVQKELEYIYTELTKLKQEEEGEAETQSVPTKSVQEPPKEEVQISQKDKDLPPSGSEKRDIPAIPKAVREKSTIEKYVGENLISSLGVLVIIIGVGFGAKYAIDNQLVSPVMRIIAGLSLGIFIGGTGLYLKPKYPTYSAFLLGGSIAIIYWLTYAAFSYYQLISEGLTYGLMVFYTIGTIYAALIYKNQIFALFGLVGAYAVPFLIGQDSENINELLSYILLINIGIMVVSLKQYWKAIYYTSFILTWSIVVSWVSNYYEPSLFNTGFYFGLGFFIVFYLTYIGYKLLRNEALLIEDVSLLILNALTFYAIGYYIFDSLDNEYALGIFTICNAVIHLGIAMIIQLRPNYDLAANRFIIGLGLLFAVLAIPVQFDGNWVTLIWIAMSLLLIYTGRSTKEWFYEVLAYPLIILSFFSLFHDLGETSGTTEAAFWNIHFGTSLIYVVCLALIYYLRNKYSLEVHIAGDLKKLMNILIGAILGLALYGTLSVEISRFFITDDLNNQGLWQMISQVDAVRTQVLIAYTMAFVTSVYLSNRKYFKSATLNYSLQFISLLLLLIYLTTVLNGLGNFREYYFENPDSLYYREWLYLYFRYIVLLIFIPFYWSLNSGLKSEKSIISGSHLRTFLFNVSLIWILSAETIHWLEILGMVQSYKLGLSLLWILYAGFAVVYGLKVGNKYLRYGGMGLFAITILKIFVYDAADISTLSKTLLFIVLGLVLLSVSYLYFRFRDRLWDDK